jgi:RecA/RadA recombinase
MSKYNDPALDALTEGVKIDIGESIDTDKLEQVVEETMKKAPARSRKKKEDTEKKPPASGSSMSPIDVFKKVGGDLRKFGYTMAEDDVTEWIDSGNMGLNYLVSGFWVNGGFPRRKIAEYFGPSGGAKSTMGYIVGANVQKLGGIFAVIDSEGAHNVPFMRMLGIDPTLTFNLVPRDSKDEPYYAVEACFLMVKEFIAKIRQTGFTNPVHILYDSIAMSPLSDDWEKMINGEEISEDQGRKAKMVGQWQRVINGYVRGSDNTLHIINQIRERVLKGPAARFGPKEVTTSGRSTEYASDTRIDIRRTKSISRASFKAKKQGEEDGGKEWLLRKLGGFFKVTCEKSRQTSPFRVLENMELFFDAGIAPFSGIFDLMLRDEWIAMTSRSGYYTMVDPSSRNSGGVLKTVDDFPSFTRRDVDEGDWIYENAGFFGGTAEDLMAYAEKYKIAHAFSKELKIAVRKKAAMILDDDDEDGDEGSQERESAVDRIIKKTGGKFKDLVSDSRPIEDETRNR